MSGRYMRTGSETRAQANGPSSHPGKGKGKGLEKFFPEEIVAEPPTYSENTDWSNSPLWDSLEIRFPGAVLVESMTESGLLREDAFISGLRVATRYVDQSGLMAWTDATNFYDEFGVRIEKLTHYESGLQRKDVYENGLRLSTTFTDLTPDSDWETIVNTYDVLGNRIQKTIVYDNGSTRETNYVDDQRVSEFRTDGAHEDWSTIENVFSPFGDLEKRIVIQDDGVLRQENYFAQSIVKVEEVDLQDVFDWYEVSWTYDESGLVDRREINFDNGDIAIMLYLDGERSSRVELDADGDELWTYRVTNYASDGSLEVETYLEGEPFDWDAFGSAPTDGTGGTVPPSDLPLPSLAGILEPDVFLM